MMKTLKKIMVFCVFLFFVTGISAKAAESVDTTDNQDGTVNITYSNPDNKNIAIQVLKSGESNAYKYFISGKNIDVNIPMTQGNGLYTIMVYKNTTGNKYSPLSQQKVTLSLQDEKSAFLTSFQLVDWDTKNNAIKYASKLTKSCKTDYDKIKAVYKYIVENYSYDFEKLKTLSAGVNYVPDIDAVYKEKKGICYDISSLNASMLRSQDVETKLIMGYPTNPALKENTYHAWNKVYNAAKKEWIIMDATTDMQLYTKVDYKVMNKKKTQYSDERLVY